MAAVLELTNFNEFWSDRVRNVALTFDWTHGVQYAAKHKCLALNAPEVRQ